MDTIGHITAHNTMRPGNTVQLTHGGVEWTVTRIRPAGAYEVTSPGGRRRTVSPGRVVTVNRARVIPEADWVR